MTKLFSIILILLAFIFLPKEVSAQSNINKRLQFVYIEHELQTPVSTLIKRMKKRYDEVEEFKDKESLVVYLSSGIFSPVAFVNLEEYADETYLRANTSTGKPRDKRDAFDNVLESMNNANSHTVNATSDVNNILDILEGFEVFADDGSLNYKSLTFDFYIGPSFWLQRNNEKIIARLYAVLQLGEQNDNNITFNVFKSKSMVLDFPEGVPFGEQNLNGINSKLRILEYNEE